MTTEPEARSVEDAVTDAHRDQYVALVRFATLVLRDRGDAEDVVQEAFERAGAAWRRHGLPDVPAAYLRRTVANLCQSRLRRRAVRERLTVVGSATAASPEDAVVLRDDQRAVLAALAELSPRQRTCLCLRFYLDLSDREVAEAVGISLGSAKTHLRRGLEALGRTLEAHR